MTFRSNETLDFINRFKSSNPSAMEEAFTRGNCYWFAYILKKRFKEADIIYNPVKNHFACMIGNVAYDITGDIDSLGFFPWDFYCKSEKVESKRIRSQCIDLREFERES